MKRARLLLLLPLLAAGCAPRSETPDEPAPMEDAMARLPAGQAGDIVRRGIEVAGGWEAWAAHRNVAFQKTSVSFDSTGVETLRRVQTHRYVLRPSPMMRIDWTDPEGHAITLLNQDGQAWRIVDGDVSEAQADRDGAWNSTFGSNYVFSVPFKLTDEGAVFTYAGRDTLADGTVVHAVSTTYRPGAGSSAGQHTWTYLFDVATGRLAANHLQYGPAPDDHDYTEYVAPRAFGGLQIPTRRPGYRSNAAGDRLGKISESHYDSVRFDVDFPDGLFAPPR